MYESEKTEWERCYDNWSPRIGGILLYASLLRYSIEGIDLIRFFNGAYGDKVIDFFKISFGLTVLSHFMD